MKLDFSVAITAYELLAIVLSMLAIAIPFLKWLYKRIFLRLELKYLPNDYTITIYFNESGAYAELGFVLQCKNASIIVNNIKLCITRISDNATLLLDWSVFLSPYSQRVGGNSVYTHETTHPLKIESNGLQLFIIQYSNTNNETVNKLKQIHAEKMDAMKDWEYRSKSYDEAIASFKAQPKYSGYCDSILEEFFWKAGNYKFDVL